MVKLWAAEVHAMSSTWMSIVAGAFMEIQKFVNLLTIPKSLKKPVQLHIATLTMILLVFLLALELIMLSPFVDTGD